jgi:hypothetical protein
MVTFSFHIVSFPIVGRTFYRSRICIVPNKKPCSTHTYSGSYETLTHSEFIACRLCGLSRLTADVGASTAYVYGLNEATAGS